MARSHAPFWWMISERPDVRRPYLIAALLSFVLLVVASGLLMVNLSQERQGELRYASLDLNSRARSIGQTLNVHFDQLAGIVENVSRELELRGPDRVDGRVLDGLLWSARTNRIGNIGYAVYDTDGAPIARSTDTGTAANVAGLPFFRAHRDAYQTLVIDRTDPDRIGGRSGISFSHALTAPDGEFLGVAQIIAGAAEITNLMVADDLGGFDRATLFGGTGLVLARWPDDGGSNGFSTGTGSASPAARPDPSRPDPSRRGPANPTYVTAAYQLQSFPFRLELAVDRDAVLAKWRESRILVAGVIVTLAVLVLAFNIFLWARMRDEVERDRATRRFFSAVEQSPSSVVITDTDGSIEYVNPQFTALTGYQRDEMLGQNSRMTKSGHTSPAEYATLWATIRSGRPWRGEFLNRKKNGELFWEDTKISPIFDSDGRIINFLAVKEDITRIKDVQSAMERSMIEAKAANLAKSRFLALMSHELRTPLNAIIGFSEFMGKDPYQGIRDDRYKEYIADINASGQQLLQTINDILDLSKIESERMVLNERSISLFAVAAQCVRQSRPLLRSDGPTLQLLEPESSPILRADEIRVKEIVFNLLSNAIKFTPAGTITVALERRPDGRVSLSVSDTGCGIAAHDLSRVLQPFEQVHVDPMVRSQQGTGLGLPIVKRLAELHGGTLDIESEPGRGTTVRVTFPAERVVGDVASLEEKLAADRKSARAQAAEAADPRAVAAGS